MAGQPLIVARLVPQSPVDWATFGTYLDSPLFGKAAACHRYAAQVGTVGNPRVPTSCQTHIQLTSPRDQGRRSVTNGLHTHNRRTQGALVAENRRDRQQIKKEG